MCSMAVNLIHAMGHCNQAYHEWHKKRPADQTRERQSTNSAHFLAAEVEARADAQHTTAAHYRATNQMTLIQQLPTKNQATNQKLEHLTKLCTQQAHHLQAFSTTQQRQQQDSSAIFQFKDAY